MNRDFSKEYTQMAKGIMRKYSMSLIIRVTQIKTFHLLGWLLSEKQVITNGGKDVKKRECLYTSGGNIIWSSHNWK